MIFELPASLVQSQPGAYRLADSALSGFDPFDSGEHLILERVGYQHHAVGIAAQEVGRAVAIRSRAERLATRSALLCVGPPVTAWIATAVSPEGQGLGAALGVLTAGVVIPCTVLFSISRAEFTCCAY